MKLLNLTIARVDSPVFNGEVEWVTVPGSEGEMTLLADHAPIISALKAGTLTYKLPAGEPSSLTITHGTLEVRSNVATILI